MKKALLVEGTPKFSENSYKFRRDNDVNMQIMNQVLSKNNYEFIKTASTENVEEELEKLGDYDEFLFYFSGHANSRYMDSMYNSKENLFNSVDRKANKYFVFDSCSRFIGGDDENSLYQKMPENSRFVWAEEVAPSKSIAKVIHDATVSRGNSLQDLNQEAFNNIKQGWVQVMDKFDKQNS